MEKQIVAYYRLSKMDKSSTGLGLEAQQAIVRHYYRGQIKEFTEIKSAKNITERPVLQEAIAYCKKHGSTLVVAKLDRLSRNVDDCRHVLNVLGSHLRACDIPGELDKFSLTLFAAFSERERELIALRTSQALQAKIKRDGKWQTGSKKFISGEAAALGRKTNTKAARENGHNRRAAGVICIKRTEGQNFQEIADFLNENGFLAPRGGKFTACQAQRVHAKFCTV